MQAAQPPLGWSLEDKAAAVLSVIHDAVNGITNPRWKNAALAAFRVPPDQYKGSGNDSIAGRWRELARREGNPGGQLEAAVERYRGYWMTAARHLAEDVARRFHLLNNSAEGWKPLRTSGRRAPALTPPIAFEKVDVLYIFDGHRGVRSICQCWITASDECDHYEARAWYYSQPDAPVEIIPLANCELSRPLQELPLGGRYGALKFARTLHTNDTYFFSYETLFNSRLQCRPTILFQPRALGMRSLVMRAQFDKAVLPTKCWYLDMELQIDDSQIPEDGAPELLEIASNGYVEHAFHACERGRQYGVRWIWPQDS
ncbi:MAG: hypothetical protein ACRDS0_07255 [Pseudonocardiaceae bacterium]